MGVQLNRSFASEPTTAFDIFVSLYSCYLEGFSWRFEEASAAFSLT